MFQEGVGSGRVGVAGSAHTMALGTIQKRNRVCVCACAFGWWRSACECISLWVCVWCFFSVCVCVAGYVSCVDVTVCSYISVAKQEVCGVKVAWRKLDVVHDRQNVTSKTTKNVTPPWPQIWQILQIHHHIPHYENRKSPLMRHVLIKGCDSHFLDLHLQRSHVQQTGCQVFWQSSHRFHRVFPPKYT